MGKIADLYCDIIYLTDDNPRNENPNLQEEKLKKVLKEVRFMKLIENKNKKCNTKSQKF